MLLTDKYTHIIFNENKQSGLSTVDDIEKSIQEKIKDNVNKDPEIQMEVNRRTQRVKDHILGRDKVPNPDAGMSASNIDPNIAANAKAKLGEKFPALANSGAKIDANPQPQAPTHMSEVDNISNTWENLMDGNTMNVNNEYASLNNYNQDPFESALDSWMNYDAMPGAPVPQPPVPGQVPQMPPRPQMPGAPVPQQGVAPQPPAPGAPAPQMPMPNPQQGAAPQGQPAPQQPGMQMMDTTGDGKIDKVDMDGSGPGTPQPVTIENGKPMVDPDGPQGPKPPVPLNVPPETVDGNGTGDDSDTVGRKPEDVEDSNPVFQGLDPEKITIAKKKLTEMGARITKNGKIILLQMPSEIMKGPVNKALENGEASVEGNPDDKQQATGKPENEFKAKMDAVDAEKEKSGKRIRVSETEGLPVIPNKEADAPENYSYDLSDGCLAYQIFSDMIQSM